MSRQYHTIKNYKEKIDSLTKDLAQAMDLLDCHVEDSKCRFDHHGGCQEHGFISLENGERCPTGEAQEVLAKYKDKK